MFKLVKGGEMHVSTCFWEHLIIIPSHLKNLFNSIRDRLEKCVLMHLAYKYINSSLNKQANIVFLPQKAFVQGSKTSFFY